MKYGSLFTGIAGFDLGFDRAGMECAWQIEQDKDCNRVRQKHYPKTKRGTDVREVTTGEFERPDVICGGFPCQDLSVAGNRAGLAGERSGLWSEFRRIIEAFAPRFVVVENVPGLLSGCGCLECRALGRILRGHEFIRRQRFETTGEVIEPCAKCVAIRDFLRAHSGRNMQIVVTGLVELGFNVATGILDSQYFGVPQRRNRVFVVGSLGNGSCAEILFEPESLRGDSAPSRETGERVAGTLGGSSQSGGFRTTDLDNSGAFIPILEAGARTGRSTEDSSVGIGVGKGGDPMYSLQSGKQHAVACFDERSVTSPGNRQSCRGDRAQSLNAAGGHSVAFQTRIARNGRGQPEEISPALSGADCGATSDMRPCVQTGAMVRRLTPRECERLQGFPDDWTRWDSAGKEISDSARYRMLGNAVTTTVSEWLGKRIVRFSVAKDSQK